MFLKIVNALAIFLVVSQLIASQDLTMFGHSDSVRSLAILPDGTLASGSSDKTIRIWDTVTGKTLKLLTGHTHEVRSLAVLLDGTLASCSYDGTIRIWDINNGQTTKILNGKEGISSLAVFPDGTLADGNWENTVRIWDVKNAQIIKTLVGHTGPVVSLLVLPDGNLASGSRDKTVRIWNIKTGQTTEILSEHKDYVLSLAMLPDGTLVSGGKDETIIFWKNGIRDFKITISGFLFINNEIRSILPLPNGNLAIGLRGYIGIFDKKNRKIIDKLNGHRTHVNALGLLADGRLVTACNDKTLQIYKYP